ncbi:hypothetical protein G8E10_24945 [Rhizobiaceae bacterium CRRU44]|uniref:Uncharacterized protein n=1 Tax=Ferranicluibacter rubi TaxID=2715133 RepID=A0AA44CES6_9HYPH|nr:hypothetical protein [Ferranicluibacter rubi]NHT78951.1 hypothetical protein [Ferranicluibacter rubi]
MSTTHETIALIDGRTKANGLAYTARVIREGRPAGDRFMQYFDNGQVLADVIRAGLYRIAKEDEQVAENIFKYLCDEDVLASVVAVEKAEKTAEGMTQKPRMEVLDLMAQWAADSWDYDLEDTEGFEFHRNELREYRIRLEQEREAEEAARILAFAKSIGCANNLPLARKLDSFEKRLNAGFSTRR